MRSVVQEDSELVENIRKGDMRAFSLAYDHYHAYLYHFALKYVKVPEQAEEVVHDVFLKIWENRSSLDSSRSFKGYLITICKNQVLNMLTRANREKRVIREIGYTCAGADNETENAIISADYEGYADQVISKLPPQRQKIFRMYRFDELNSEQISRELGISKGTVKDHLLKANRFIRKCLSAYSGVPIDISVWLIATLLF